MECRREDDDDDELSFSNEPIHCCVSIVDMGVNKNQQESQLIFELHTKSQSIIRYSSIIWQL